MTRPTDDTAEPTSVEPSAEALDEAVAGFTDAAYARDVEATAQFLEPDFEVVFLHPEMQVNSRDAFLGMLPEFVTEEYTVMRERTVLDGDRGINYKFVRMRSSVRGVPREGEFSSADYWRFDPVHGWRMWQRFSTPLSAGTLPD